MSSRRRQDDDQDSGSGSQFDPLQVLLHHKWLIVGAGLIGVALGYLHYTRQPPVYESVATLLVVPEKKTTTLPIEMIESSRSADESLSTQMILLRSPLVMEKAINHPDLQKIPSLVSSGNPAALIAGGLSVAQARASNGNLANEVLELRYRGSDSQDCGSTLLLVIDAYQQFLGETRQSISFETVELITKAKESLLKELEQKDKEYREFRQSAPPSWQGESGTTIRTDRLAQLESARTTLVIACSNLKAQITALEQAINHGTRREVLEVLAKQIGASAETQMPIGTNGLVTTATMQEQLKTLTIEEQFLQEKYGARHPKLLELRRRLQVMAKLIEEEESPKGIQLAGGSDEQTDIVQLYLESLRQELNVSEQQRTELEDVFQKELELVRSHEDLETQNTAKLADIARTNQLFEGVVKRLQEISLIKDAGGTYTQIIARPGAGAKVLPRLSTALLSGLLAGAAVGFAVGAAIELSNRDFRSVEELSQQLELGVLAQFDDAKCVARAGSVVDSTVVAYHAPQHLMTEAYRGLRTCLLYGATDPADLPRTIQITSPLPGDGKSTLVANLGVVMAQSGKRVVMIEADMRKPRLARLFGTGSSHGMTALLNGEAEVDDCLISTEVSNLWVLPVGSRPSNPSELLGSAAFRQLLEVLRDKFDVILIDSAPILPVTDASIIATLVDGVVCLFKVRTNMRAAADAAKLKLNDVGAHLLGAVVHGRFQRESRKGPRYGYYEAYYEDEDDEVEASSGVLVGAAQRS